MADDAVFQFSEEDLASVEALGALGLCICGLLLDLPYLSEHNFISRDPRHLPRATARVSLALQFVTCTSTWPDTCPQSVSYTPVDVLTWQRAILLSLYDKAEVLEYYDISVRSARAEHPLPAVLKVSVYVSGSRGSRVALSRRNVLLRDASTCQYCSAPATTLDHVMPVSRGGAWAWTNLVACCGRCNAKKGAKLPSEVRFKCSELRKSNSQQANMMLKRVPKEPAHEHAIFSRVPTPRPPPAQWEGYLKT
jgi:5-methylcytosine-specific restriction endonuclease McrA